MTESTEPTVLELPGLGYVAVTNSPYSEAINLHTVQGGVLHKGFLYSISATIIERDGLWYPQAGCDVKARNACTIPKKVRDAILTEVLQAVVVQFAANPSIIETLRLQKRQQAKQRLMERITEQKKRVAQEIQTLDALEQQYETLEEA